MPALTIEIPPRLSRAVALHSSVSREPINDIVVDALELHLDDLGPRFEPPADLLPPTDALPVSPSPGQGHQAFAGEPPGRSNSSPSSGPAQSDLELEDDEVIPYLALHGGKAAT